MSQLDRTEHHLYGPEYRLRWGPGPWQDEPDLIAWRDSETGYRCYMIRNDCGCWCGYVAVPEGHRAYKNENVRIRCHRGITKTGLNNEGEWEFGFDCMHMYSDVVPGIGVVLTAIPELDEGLLKFEEFMEQMQKRFEERTGRKAVYRDVPYVTECVSGMARQLAQIDATGTTDEEAESLVALAEQFEDMENHLLELQAAGEDVSLDLARIGGARRTLGIPEIKRLN